MISIQHLFHTIEDFKQKMVSINIDKECLIQIFTTVLEPNECVALAKEIKYLFPLAHIIGSSVNGIIYRGKQFERHTMITVEQYDYCQIDSHLLDITDQNAQEVVDQLQKVWDYNPPKLLRLFLGAYYPEAHQMMDCINTTMPSMQVVGGMSGELCHSPVLPFVFNDTRAIHSGLSCAGLTGEFSTYNRINTAHKRVSAPYTITKSVGRTIYEIEGEPAQDWLQHNLGFKSTQQYDTWEDIAKCDPLVRFQISLEDYEKATRYLRFDEPTQQITQYFTELESDTPFRISYTSPSKCVEECKETCLEVMETPIEQLFCYSCLFRKLYLKNCAQWELSPYHKNPISGVFLLGEFGHHQGYNEVLNGSCVLSGICEEEHYLQVDLSRLGALYRIQLENEGLFDFLINKNFQSKSDAHKQLITDVMAYERKHQPDFYRYIDSNFNLSNMLQYELDKAEYGFDKLCLLKIENADILMSFMGQTGYVDQIKKMVTYLEQLRTQNSDDIFVYSSNSDTFVIAATAAWTMTEFIELIQRIDNHYESIQDNFIGTPIIMHFIIVSESEYLLEQAYGQMELNKNSQARMIIHHEEMQDKASIKEELSCITMIQNAIMHNQIIPYYQGIYNNETKQIDKYEALMRLRDANGNILAPYSFMETAKKYRLYLDLNLKMFEAVLNDFSTIDCAININLCAHDIDSPKFRSTLRKRLSTFHKPQNITFEILEDEYFSDIEVLKDFIDEVRSYGARISIDDFGSGYSNLLEIIKIQPDTLKIDGKIIRECHIKQENEIIVSAISTLAQRLSIDLVAEFVGNEEIQQIVEKYDILHSQGYLFSKPQPFSEICKTEQKITASANINNLDTPVSKVQSFCCPSQKYNYLQEIIGLTSVTESQDSIMHRLYVDELTGCLQKRVFEEVVCNNLKIQKTNTHAMIIIDLDNFKSVNDNLGHQFGDMVLTEVGEKLRSLFRNDDYIGRIGGDEFMVLMRNTASIELITEKANAILEALDCTYQGSLHQYHISASVGIAIYPADGQTFNELYDHADIALFDAKNRGKNEFVFYNEKLSKGTMENTMPYDVASRALSQHFDAKIVSQSFNILFETEDFDTAMHEVLELLGIRFGVSRVYIFERSKANFNYYDNTYEWYADGIKSGLSLSQNIPKETFRILMKQGNTDGIIYCNDVMSIEEEVREILDAQDIKSFLHAYICADNEILYAIGFDDCLAQRVWSPIEISTLLHVSKIIALFLNYKNILK